MSFFFSPILLIFNQISFENLDQTKYSHLRCIYWHNFFFFLLSIHEFYNSYSKDIRKISVLFFFYLDRDINNVIYVSDLEKLHNVVSVNVSNVIYYHIKCSKKWEKNIILCKLYFKISKQPICHTWNFLKMLIHLGPKYTPVIMGF